MSTTDQVHLVRDREKHLGFVTFSHPGKRNAITAGMVQQLKDILTQIEDDDTIKAAVFSGEGDDFTSGMDAGEVFNVYETMPGGKGGKRPSQRARLYTHDRLGWGHNGVYSQFARCSKVTVLAVAGYCLEFGLYLALGADLIVATSTARFGNPRWEYSGVDSDLSMLVSAVGLKRAKSMVFAGLELSAEEARAFGLVDRVVEPSNLIPMATELAQACAAQVPLDGIVVGKYHLSAALDALGLGVNASASVITAAVTSNLHHGPDEFNFLKERRGLGVSAAIDAGRKHFSNS